MLNLGAVVQAVAAVLLPSCDTISGGDWSGLSRTPLPSATNTIPDPTNGTGYPRGICKYDVDPDPAQTMQHVDFAPGSLDFASSMCHVGSPGTARTSYANAQVLKLPASAGGYAWVDPGSSAPECALKVDISAGRYIAWSPHFTDLVGGFYETVPAAGGSGSYTVFTHGRGSEVYRNDSQVKILALWKVAPSTTSTTRTSSTSTTTIATTASSTTTTTTATTSSSTTTTATTAASSTTTTSATTSLSTNAATMPTTSSTTTTTTSSTPVSTAALPGNNPATSAATASTAPSTNPPHTTITQSPLEVSTTLAATSTPSVSTSTAGTLPPRSSSVQLTTATNPPAVGLSSASTASAAISTPSTNKLSTSVARASTAAFATFSLTSSSISSASTGGTISPSTSASTATSTSVATTATTVLSDVGDSESQTCQTDGTKEIPIRSC